MFLFSFMTGDSRSYSPSCRDLSFAFTLVMKLMGTESWRHGVYCYGDAGERDVDANPLLRMTIYRCDVTQRDAFDSIKEETSKHRVCYVCRGENGNGTVSVRIVAISTNIFFYFCTFLAINRNHDRTEIYTSIEKLEKNLVTQQLSLTLVNFLIFKIFLTIIIDNA